MYTMLLSYCYGWVAFLFDFLTFFFKGPTQKRGMKIPCQNSNPTPMVSLQILASKTSSCMGSELLVKAFMVAIIYIYIYISIYIPSFCAPLPTSAPWKMNDKWSRNSFLLGFSSLANHGG